MGCAFCACRGRLAASGRGRRARRRQRGGAVWRAPSARPCVCVEGSESELYGHLGATNNAGDPEAFSPCGPSRHCGVCVAPHSTHIRIEGWALLGRSDSAPAAPPARVTSVEALVEPPSWVRDRLLALLSSSSDEEGSATGARFTARTGLPVGCCCSAPGKWQSMEGEKELLMEIGTLMEKSAKNRTVPELCVRLASVGHGRQAGGSESAARGAGCRRRV
jgi:hypothetical protein